MANWFLLQNDNVTGPYAEDDIRAQIVSATLASDTLIWGQPMPAWKNLAAWEKELPQLRASIESTVTQQHWHYAINGDSKGPMTRAELINEIKNTRAKGEVLVWTKGMKAWADLYEFHDLLDDIGVNRRDHPRAPINGKVTIKFNETVVLLCTLKSISPGGFSAMLSGNQLVIGQTVNAEIKSDQLNVPIVAKATVQYSNEFGLYGFKFLAVNMEVKAHIMEYIRTEKTTTESAA